MTDIVSFQQIPLLKQIQLYRFMFDLQKIKSQIEKHKQLHFPMSNLMGKAKNTRKKISNLIKQNPEISVKNDLEMKTVIAETFKTDFYNLQKISFVMHIIYDETKFEFSKDSLYEVSKLFFDDPKKLFDIKKQYESVYKLICKKELSPSQRGILIVNATIAVAATMSLAMVKTGGLHAPANQISSSLKMLGFGNMHLGPAVISLYSSLVLCTVSTATYVGLEFYNKEEIERKFKEEIKKKFRDMKSEDIALELALDCLLINELEKHDKTMDLKNEIDELLSNVSDLRGDVQYLLFVERENIEENKEKLRLFNRFDQQLIKIMGLSDTEG